jgi:hypothetical protein
MMDTVSIIIPSNFTPSSPNQTSSSCSSSFTSSLSSDVFSFKKRTSLTEEEELHEPVLRVEAAKATVADALKIANETAEIAAKAYEEVVILQQAYAMKKRAQVANDELREVINVNLLTPTNVVLEERSIMIENQSVINDILDINKTFKSIVKDIDVAIENEEVLVASQSIIDDFQSIVETLDTIIETVEILVDVIPLNDFYL